PAAGVKIRSSDVGFRLISAQTYAYGRFCTSLVDHRRPRSTQLRDRCVVGALPTPQHVRSCVDRALWTAGMGGATAGRVVPDTETAGLLTRHVHHSARSSCPNRPDT